MARTTRFTLGATAAILSLGLAFAPAAFAQDKMSKDGMKKEDAMSKDSMKKDTMSKDGMKKDSMAKDGMKKDESLFSAGSLSRRACSIPDAPRGAVRRVTSLPCVRRSAHRARPSAVP